VKVKKLYAICPKCGEKINYLEVYHTTISKIYAIEDYDNDKEELIEDNGNWNDYREYYHYLCPKCHKEIAKNDDEILELFNNTAKP